MKLEPYMDLVDPDDVQDCASCGDEFEVGQFAVTVSAGFGEDVLGGRAVVSVHFHCAVQGQEIDLTGTVRGYGEKAVPAPGG